jgi:hypothetical protein
LHGFKKVVQSFLGKINFNGRFIPNFAKLTKPISNLLKKEPLFRWNDESREAFNKIKEAINSCQVTVSLDYN